MINHWRKVAEGEDRETSAGATRPRGKDMTEDGKMKMVKIVVLGERKIRKTRPYTRS